MTNQEGAQPRGPTCLLAQLEPLPSTLTSSAQQGGLGCRMQAGPTSGKAGGAASNPLEGDPHHLAHQTPPTHSAAGAA